MRHGIGLLVFVVGCSSSGTDRALPSATFTPHLERSAADVACGEDSAFYGNAQPDLRTSFSYDTGGRITHADGVWQNGGQVDTTDYGWSGDNFTHMLWTSGWDGSQSEISAAYDAQNQLVDYTWSETSPDFSGSWQYTMSNFVGLGQPGREAITDGQSSVVYDLVYDGDGRLVAANPNAGDATTWTYDDAARTIDVDTGNGAYHGVYAYDDDFRPISETSGGSAAGMVDTETTYDWTAGPLSTITYRSGSEQAPHTLDLIETDTMRYDCAAARARSRQRLAPAAAFGHARQLR